MIFRYQDKEFQGATAVAVVLQIKNGETDFAAANGSTTIREFLEWSLKTLSNRLPLRELDLSPRVSDEIQARAYLSLRHDYGIGQLIE